MKAETTKWRVEERDGESTRALTVEAGSWEAAVQSAWTTWALDHELRRAGVEVGLSATQIFIRGTPFSYRVAPEAAPRKRVVPRPVSSIPPPMPIIDVGAAANPPAAPANGEAPKLPPRKVEPRVQATSSAKPKVEAKPSGRALFGKLPRASSPDLEQEARKSRASQPDATEARAPSRSEPDPAEAEPSEAEAQLPRRSSPSRPPVPFEVASAVEKLSHGRTPNAAFPPPPRMPDALPTPPTPAPVPVQAATTAPEDPSPLREEPAPTKVNGRRLQMLVAGAVQLYAREQDPKNGAPVVYRQRGYALPMGTEENEAEAFGRWMLQQLQAQIPGGETPRLFHLAVYDEMFTGDPPILALCKLEWKEWKDQTNVSFPRRGEDSIMAAPRARTPSMHPPEMSAVVPPPGNPTSHAGKSQGRVAALFLPPVTPPSFAVQPAPHAPVAPGATRGSEGNK